MRIRRCLSALLLAPVPLLGVLVPPTPAGAAPADPAGTAYQNESVRAMTWNICGEAGGVRGQAGFCPFRNEPQRKIDAIVGVVNQRQLNAVVLQELCADAAGSHLDRLQRALGSGWSFAWAEQRRPDGRSDCRAGLPGTAAIAIAVKGTITERTEDILPLPAGVLKMTKLLCVRVQGWVTRICDTHISHDTEEEYPGQIAKIVQVIGNEPWVVLGGDFNSSYPYSTDTLKSLYDRFAECDQQQYYPGEAANEPTHNNNGTDTEEPRPATKLDYLWARSGWTNCDSAQELADHTRNISTSTEEPSGVSDHAPVFGYTRGRPLGDWRLDAGSGSTAADSSGNGRTGTFAGNVRWSGERNGSVTMDGTGSIATAARVVDTSRSFTVSAWAKPATDATTGVIASQDGAHISGFMLWYEPSAPAWVFGMPTGDAEGATIERISSGSGATPNVWTHVGATYDSVAGRLSLYVNGALVGTRTRAARWAATGPFVIGRDQISGHPNAFWRGGVDDVQVYDYPLTGAELANLRTGQQVLTSTYAPPADPARGPPRSTLPSPPSPPAGKAMDA